MAEVPSFAYPAGAAPLYRAFYLSSRPDLIFVILLCLLAVVALIATWLFLRRHSASARETTLHFLTLILLLYPLAYLAERANIELILWLLLLIALLAFLKNRSTLAVTAIGLATAVKYYPILLAGELLSGTNLRSRKAFLAVAIAILALCASIAYTGPSFMFAMRGFFHGVSSFQKYYAGTVRSSELSFDHSLFAPLKLLAEKLHRSPAPWLKPYYAVAGLLCTALFLRVRTLPQLNRIVFLIAAMISLPPVSYTYTLVHLYLPFLLLFTSLRSGADRSPTSAWIALALIASLLLPLNILHAVCPFLAGPVQSLLLLALLIASASQPWNFCPVIEPDAQA